MIKSALWDRQYDMITVSLGLSVGDRLGWRSEWNDL